MRIINTVRKLKVKRQKAKVKAKTRNLYFYLFTFTFLLFLAGCVQKSALEQAKDYATKSQDYYEKTIALYKDLISRGKDLDNLRLELGKLYYKHGDFKEAIEEFRNTSAQEAKKFLAISYYRLGNFTDALQGFDKSPTPDEESLYYYGLTCEKLNLFDRALEIYKKIKSQEFASWASKRINVIERQVGLAANIKDISPKVSEIIASAPPQEKYPQAGALILSCDEKIEITPENTQISSLYYIVKILNERGKEGFSESQIEYDSTYEKVVLEYARTIKPDGTIADVGTRHMRDVSKYLNFPLYSNARVFIISFPEIVEGATVEYKIKVYRNQLINKKDFVLSYPLQTSEPIIAATFTIDLPKDRVLYLKTLNDKYNNFGANLKPDIQESNGHLTYSWQFKDIPEIIPESGMPPSAEINPAMLISTFNNWQDIYNWWWVLAKDKMRADTAIKDKVKELTLNKDSAEAKLSAIYNFCAQKIRYVAVEYGEAGYEPHKAEDVFKNKYGDCKDQAILLVTMLKEAGFSSSPVLIPTKGYYNLNEDFPAVLFNHCIAAVSLKDKIIFLDPTAETCSFTDLPVDDQGRKVLLLKEEGYQIQSIPLYPAEHNLIKQDIKIKVNSDESITAQKAVFTYGMYDQAQRAWLLYTPPELIEQTLKERIQDISIGAKLASYNIKNLADLNTPIVLNYAFGGPEYFTEAGSLRILPQWVGLDTSLVAKDERKYPIDFAVLEVKEMLFELEISNNFLVKYIPENLTEDSPWLKFTLEYSHKGNKIILKQNTVAKKSFVSEEEYPAFKTFYEDLAKKTKQRIILEKLPSE